MNFRLHRTVALGYYSYNLQTSGNICVFQQCGKWKLLSLTLAPTSPYHENVIGFRQIL